MNNHLSEHSIRLYISYALEDSETVSSLIRNLKRNDVDIYDPYSNNFSIKIDLEQVVNEVDGVIVVLSPNSMPDRPEVTRQWFPFLRQQKRIFPIIIEDCQVHEKLQSFQMIDATHGVASSLSELMAALRDNDSTLQSKNIAQSQMNGGDTSTIEQIIQTSSRRVGLSSEASDHNAVSDKPTRDVSHDKLGFAPYVFGLKEFIDSLDTQTPLTIGLNGKWGSGKSSMMRMLETELKKSTEYGTLTARAKWALDWVRGTLWVCWGHLWLLILKLFRQTQRAEDIRLALYFGRSIPNMVTNEFDAQFCKYIDSLIEQGILSETGTVKQPHEPSDTPELHQVKYHQRLEKWARRSYLRVMMPPARHYCVWFNAWKYNDQNQIWAALALATLRQLSENTSKTGRAFIVIRQTWQKLRRFKVNPILLFQKNVFPALFAIFPVTFEAFVKAFVKGISLINDKAQFSATDIHLTTILNFINPQSWNSTLITTFISLLWIGKRKIEAPISMAFAEALKSPKYDYSTQIGFIGTFEKDFEEIIDRSVLPSISNHPGKLVIFIDDLDRCAPAQTAEVIEAINLFLESRGCVFVLGMDMAIVAASIESKYVQLAEVLRQSSPDIVSFGKLFLDKIIQVPLNVPRANDKSSTLLVEELFEKQHPIPPKRNFFPHNSLRLEAAGSDPAKSKLYESQSSSQQQSDIDWNANPKTHEKVSFARLDIQKAIKLGSRLMDENVRQIKRFVNVFRLQVYISDRKQLLSDDPLTGLSPHDLAVWVAWQMKWPELSGQLSNPIEKENIVDLLNTLATHTLLEENDPYIPEGNLVEDEKTAVQIALTRYKQTPGGQRVKPFLDNWLLDREFLFSIGYLGKYWSGEKSLEILLDLPHPIELSRQGSMITSV